MKSLLNKLFGARSSGEVQPINPPPLPPLVSQKKEDIWNKIIQILNVWETGTIDGRPSLISIFHDGYRGRKQVTLGVGFTEDGGNLKRVVERYINKGGKYSNFFAPYLPNMGNTSKPSLVEDASFFETLKKSSKEDNLMIESQKEIFEEIYLASAKKFVKENEFLKPISWLVFCDSALHSGQPAPGWIRKTFPEKTPKNDGDEIQYVRAYLKARRNWLKSKGGILAKTTYRVENIINHLESKDYDLNKPFFANGVWVA